MTLPTKEDYLGQLRPDECPICYEDITSPHTTECRHAFCLECLKIWAQTSHTCPTCRRELYQGPPEEVYDDEYDDEDNTDAEGEDRRNDPSFDYDGAGLRPQDEDRASGGTDNNEDEEQVDSRDTEWILRGYVCRRDEVAGYFNRTHQVPEDFVGQLESNIIWVDHVSLVDAALASVLFVQPRLPPLLGNNARTAGWQADVCRPEWRTVTVLLMDSLARLRGRVMRADAFQAQLTRDITPHLLTSDDLSDEGTDWPDYPDHIKDYNGRWTFEDHVNQMIAYVAHHAYDMYIERAESLPDDLDFETRLDDFYLSLTSEGALDFQFCAVDTLNAWRKLESNGWDSQFLLTAPARVEYFPLFGIAVAAMWKAKPEENLYDEQTMTEHCHREWIVIIQALHEKLVDLQHQNMTAGILRYRLTEHCFQRIRGQEFLHNHRHAGTARFNTGVQMVLDQIARAATEL